MELFEIKDVRIGDVLKEYGYITDDELKTALEFQKSHKNQRIGNVLVNLGYITETQMLQALAKRLRLQMVSSLNANSIDIEAVKKIPRQLAEKYLMLAIKMDDRMITVVTNDPMNFYAIEDIRQVTGLQVEIMLCEKDPLTRAIYYQYSELEAKEAALKANESITEEIEEISIEDSDDDTPIIKLLNSLIVRAVNSNSSDIHIEPFEDKSLVRMRIDGTIIEYVALQKNLHARLIARVKILADMDIAERRTPQDGHFKTRVENDIINIRVSMIPTIHGEKAVLRIFTQNAVVDYPGNYGMRTENFEKVKKMLASPNGIIYLTGPTGSGKTTTLYMILEEIAKRQVNISTIEDPVEKNISRVNQMQVNSLAGLTFESGLRALLRQDPDIIMVGETRDAETAAISVRAAITGHQVLSTLHTNDATSTIVRLVDMGLEPYMIANSLVGAVAQRLMRKVCPMCCVTVDTTDEERRILGGSVRKIKKACGCANCNNTGYKGRVAIHEILIVDRHIREMISNKESMENIRDYAINHQGMKLLQEAAAEMVILGKTTMEEYSKVAYSG